ncbi:hypothetical protein HY933_03900 [Candidatus Falkowbacteria bacterium]|nr:hypothetical protein [Candidatus Falkowbacteria bacterium]
MEQYRTNPWVIVSAVVITAVLAGGVVYWYINSPKTAETEQQTIKDSILIQPSSTPQNDTQPTEVKVSVQDIQTAFSKKYPDRDYSNYTITIDNNYNDLYVEGLAGAPEGGGAHYWAAKVNGEWIVVQEAQDSVPCSVFEPYNFPREIIGNDCY